MKNWHLRELKFKFQLSDLTLFSISRILQVRSETVFGGVLPINSIVPSTNTLEVKSQGFFIRSLRVVEKLPAISSVGGYLRYVPLHYQHYYIDLRLSFDDYQKKFSSKTKSTMTRKVKKYAEHCGGSIVWKTYRICTEMQEFIQLARIVSKKSYQEKLLNAGIPDSDEFVRDMELLAAEGRVRAYVLFDGDRPVSYLYCPIYDGVLIYAYLGYDPDYMKMSVGTILQWLVVEQLFAEGCFRFFDFTEGESAHKHLFATNDVLCANVFFLKKTFLNRALIYSHFFMGVFSKWLGDMLERLDLKAKIKRMLRFRKGFS